MTPLVRLENVDVVLEGAPILREITWQLERGASWAVLGGNGSGKSTFLRLIRGELWPAPGRGRRTYCLDGAEQSTAVGVAALMPLVSPETQTRCLQMEWNRTVQQLIESGFGGGDYNYQRLNRRQREQTCDAAEQVGVRALWRRNIQQLSTGELRRALIARALASQPRVLVCDEVCDGLDAAARQGLLELLHNLARGGTPLLIATHRAEELIPAITHRLTLARGRIVAPETPQGSRASPASRRAIQHRLGPRSSPVRNEALPSKGGSASTLIRIEGASVYLQGQRVLRDIHWELRRGEHWAMQGPNGSGKSTFLKLVAGDLHAARGGRVQRFQFTARNTLWELRRRIGFVSPEFQALYREDLTGAEIIASGYFSSVGLMERPSISQLRRAESLAGRLGFGALVSRKALTLSYGEFRKLLLARALVRDPDLLVLDEPFDGLDAAARQDMTGVLERAAQKGATLVMVTHHTADLPRCISHRAQFEAGRLLIIQGPWPARTPSTP